MSTYFCTWLLIHVNNKQSINRHKKSFKISGYIMFLECCTLLKMPVLFTVNDFAIMIALITHIVITNNFCGKTVASAKGGNVALRLLPRAAAPEDGCRLTVTCACETTNKRTNV